MSTGGKKPKGEVHEVINALEVLSAQNGQRPDVVQNKRDCFQVRQGGAGRGVCSCGFAGCLAPTAAANEAAEQVLQDAEQWRGSA